MNDENDAIVEIDSDFDQDGVVDSLDQCPDIP